MILSILFFPLLGFSALSNALDDVRCVPDSFLNLLALRVNTVFFEVDSFSQLVDVGDILLRKEKLGIILEDGL
ncbi:MAG: hypothetical protein KDD45_14705, partial [Bdellovibrionales bacterium]|nr:hypothetical protein [Bdellovibrionales bacterium]